MPVMAHWRPLRHRLLAGPRGGGGLDPRESTRANDEGQQ